MNLTWALFLLCFFMGLASWLVFWWSVRTGQFQEAELAAAEMLENDGLDGTEPHEPSAEERRALRPAWAQSPSEESER